jgi:hypothetical protein
VCADERVSAAARLLSVRHSDVASDSAHLAHLDEPERGTRDGNAGLRGIRGALRERADGGETLVDIALLTRQLHLAAV